MTSCRVVRKHVDALVDGELDSTAQLDFEKHLSTCVICREHADFSRSMKTANKTALAGVQAPAHLRLRLLTALDSAPRPAPPAPPAQSRLGRYALPAAAAAVVALAFAAHTDDPANDAMAVAAIPVFEDVVRRHSSDHPAEVHGSAFQMSRWFQRKLQFPARAMEFARTDVQLVGARLSNVRERDAAAFYYQVHGQRVTVIVFEPPPDTLLGARRVEVAGREVYYRNVHGYTVPMVQLDGLTYAFTGDLDSQSMIQLAASAHVGH